MKNIYLLLAVFFTISSMSAQGVFDRLEDLDDVSAVVVTKDAFELLKKFPNAKSEDMEVFNVLKGLQELKIFSTEKTAIASKMENMVNKSISGGGLTELMRVKDKGTRAKIYVKSTKNKDIVSEVLMFVKNSNDGNEPSATVISLLGDVDVNKLAEIANKYEKKQ